MSTTGTAALADLNDLYTDAVNRAVAEDRMDLVAQLEREFDDCLEQLGVVAG